MREGTTPLVRREDYAPPAYFIRSVELTFDLDPAKTLVTSKMAVKRNNAQAFGPLVLKGEATQLTNVHAVSAGYPLRGTVRAADGGRACGVAAMAGAGRA